MSKSHTSYKLVSADGNANKYTVNDGKGFQEEPGVDDDADDPRLTSCGLGSWRPLWLQVFASPVFFMINFSLVGIIQGMTGTYIVASMTTLEKRFAFDSKMAGVILIADNFAQMMLSPIVGYLGSRLNRPRLIAFGELFLSLSCFTTALPYLIYGPGTHLLHDDKLGSTLLKNATKYEFCPANEFDTDCSNGNHATIWPAVIIIWFGSFFRGMGYTAFFVIGMPYIDDSVSKKQSPIYISLITAMRLLGPAGGYLLSSFSLSFYENPFYNPGITRRDPRFIGAWWIGFTVIGTLLLIATIPMFLFPKQLKTASVKARDLKDNVKGVEGTISAVKRLTRNPILMLHLIGNTIRYIGLGGFYVFKPKYIESQYRLTSSGASLLTGTTSILPMAIGIVSGGALISFFKPRPRTLVIYMFLVELCSNSAIFTGMFLGCPPLKMPSTYSNSDGFTLNSPCNRQCECTTSVFTPICASDKETTYFSPCFAGCNAMDRSKNTLSGCACTGGGTATTGYCESDSQNCNKIYIYLLVLTMGSVISSTARTGNYLLTLRSVDPKDKSFAMGMMSTFMAIFAFIPYPLIFGAITDSTCLVWEKTCGKTGNCWLYDQDKFRYYLHGASFFFLTIGSLFDIGIIFIANRIKDFYDNDSNEEKSQTSDDKNDIQMNDINKDNNNLDESNLNEKSLDKNSSNTNV